MEEEELLTGKLEPTMSLMLYQRLQVLKCVKVIIGNMVIRMELIIVVLCRQIFMGLVDNYHPENSHVIPGLIRRFHEAKVRNLKSQHLGYRITTRELHVDDMARASIQII